MELAAKIDRKSVMDSALEKEHEDISVSLLGVTSNTSDAGVDTPWVVSSKQLMTIMKESIFFINFPTRQCMCLLVDPVVSS